MIYNTLYNPILYGKNMKKIFISLFILYLQLNGNFIFAEEKFFEPQNSSGKIQLTVFYLNDMHGELTKFGQIYSAKKIFDEKNSKTNAISSASGDMFIGKNKKLNLTVTKMLNRINTDIYTFGNHEFDNGSKALSEDIKKAKFKTIMTNMKIPKDNPLYKDIKSKKIVSSYILEKNGEKFGIIGAAPIGVNLGLFDKKYPVEVFSPKETIEALNNEIKKLENKNINKIILVSHLGYYGEGGDLNIAKNTSGIDVILGGHTHLEINGVQKKDINPTHLTNLVYSKTGEPVIIVQTAGINKQIGYLDVLFDNDGNLIENKMNNTVISTDNFKSDKEIEKETEKVLGKNKIVATVDIPFISSGSYEERNKENPTANLVTDAVADYAKYSNAQVVLMHSPSVREGLQGQITTYHVKYKMLPFNEKFYYIELSQKDFVDLLNTEALTSMTTDNSQMLQCSGMHYTIDKKIKFPKSPDANCIKDITIFDKRNNNEIKINPKNPSEKETVKCIVSGYLFVDKRTKNILENGKNKKLIGEQQYILLKYLKKHKHINAGREGRITIIE